MKIRKLHSEVIPPPSEPGIFGGTGSLAIFDFGGVPVMKSQSPAGYVLPGFLMLLISGIALLPAGL